MNILTLSIKQKYFDEIIAGKKTQEFREVRPTNAKKYIKYELNGKIYDTGAELPSEDEEQGEVGVHIIKYDAIKFLTGAYKDKRSYAIVEVLNGDLEVFTDENGNDIVYEHNGEEYYACQMVYTLGKVLEKVIY